MTKQYIENKFGNKINYDPNGKKYRYFVDGEPKSSVTTTINKRTRPDLQNWYKKNRDEILWHYKQGGTGVFKGDLYFYWEDGNFEKSSHLIDTKKCPVYLLSGEYDCSCTPERTVETAKRIKGSKYKIMPNIGHFPMSENPKLFFSYLLPFLKEIQKL